MIVSYAGAAITATCNTGGMITPPGMSIVPDGEFLTYTITPRPWYRLAALIVDGASVGPRSSYTFRNLKSDHALTAVFVPYLDYFAMEEGDYEEFLAEFEDGSDDLDDYIYLDSSSSQISWIDSERGWNHESEVWLQVKAQGLYMKKSGSTSATTVFSPALPLVKTPLAAGKHWTACCALSPGGGSACLNASVSPSVLVNVPAGYFFAWPITYDYVSYSSSGQQFSNTWTYWFVPYFGNVKTISGGSLKTSQLEGFRLGTQQVSTPPPVITGTSPVTGARGTTVSINGFQFGDNQDESKVLIGNAECSQDSYPGLIAA